MATDGLLVIDKPAGPTSHDVVQRVRRLLGTRRVGHGGTLDPDATGVLLVAAGRATRFLPYLSAGRKVYEGRIRLGFATDTCDASGRPVSEASFDFPSAAGLAAAMGSFEGLILQTPPRFSAKKLRGRPGYERARAGEEFSLEPVSVTVARFVARGYDPPFVAFEAECSSGTYVRSLAHDLGARLGCGAHLAELRRTAVGTYGLAEAVPLAGLEDAAAGGEADRYVLPLERLLPWAPAATVLPGAEARVRNGSHLEPAHLAGPLPCPIPRETPLVRLFDGSGRLLALARPSPEGGRLLPFLVVM